MSSRKFIGSALVSSVQEESFSISKSIDEIDLINKNTNFLFNGEEETQDVEIDVSLIEGLTVDDKSVDELRDDLKELTSEKAEYIPVVFDSKKGFLSVESISIPENSNLQTYRQATISGSFLPWPKNFGDVDFDQRRNDVLPNIAPSFIIKSVNTNSPIVEGDTLNVASIIENDGVGEEIQNIELLDEDFNTLDSKNLTLDTFQSSNVDLSWDTFEGDAGEFTLKVSTNDDLQEFSVSIEELLEFFEVNIENTNSPIKEGEELIVTSIIENTGNDSGIQDINLRNFNSSLVDFQEVSLIASGQETIELVWNTSEGDAGTGNIFVESDDDSDSIEITIQELIEAIFFVNILSTNSPVEETETLQVNVQIENQGEKQEQKEVRLFDIRDNLVDTNNVQLDGGQTEEILMEWETQIGDEGSGEITVETEDSIDTEEVKIEIGGF